MIFSLLNGGQYIAFIFTLFGILIAIVVHEFAHALMADFLGDPNPRNQGRVSLNPLVHLDPLGFVLILATNFGWGKPVAFDPYNLKNPKRDSAFIALAGPIANLILFFFGYWIYNLSLPASLFSTALKSAITTLMQINLYLALFNLVPVYPLDGSHVLSALLPKQLSYQYDIIMEKFGIIILFFLIAPISHGKSPISYLLEPIIVFFLNIF